MIASPMNASPQITQWVDVVRDRVQLLAMVGGLAAGTLIQTGGVPIPLPRSDMQAGEVVIVSEIPDGTIDPNSIFYIGGPQGVEQAVWQPASQDNSSEELSASELARTVLEHAGLNMTEMAHVMGVSRPTYYEWMREGRISIDNKERLENLLNTLQTLQDLRGGDLPSFLRAHGPAGRPLDLLAADNASAVIGLALRPTMHQLVNAPRISREARQISGAMGWLRPVSPLGWQRAGADDAALARALADDTLPTLLGESLFPHGDEDDEPAFIAHGYYTE